MEDSIKTIKSEKTWWVKIYISGPIEIAKQVIREYALSDGLCVTIDPTIFIYTGGEESGYVVGLVNYPRFPVSFDSLEIKGKALALLLLEKTFQHSALVMSPLSTIWYSKREQ